MQGSESCRLRTTVVHNGCIGNDRDNLQCREYRVVHVPPTAIEKGDVNLHTKLYREGFDDIQQREAPAFITIAPEWSSLPLSACRTLCEPAPATGAIKHGLCQHESATTFLGDIRLLPRRRTSMSVRILHAPGRMFWHRDMEMRASLSAAIL